MPFASITISTREGARVRDNLVNIAATKISAGVSTGIGSHVDDIEDKGDDQFEISDGRSVEMCIRDSSVSVEILLYLLCKLVNLVKLLRNLTG